VPLLSTTIKDKNDRVAFNILSESSQKKQLEKRSRKKNKKKKENIKKNKREQ